MYAVRVLYMYLVQLASVGTNLLEEPQHTLSIAHSHYLRKATRKWFVAEFEKS